MKTNVRFEFDPRKSETNRRKHGIEFPAVIPVFADPLKKLNFEGYDHGEARWRTIGEIDRVVFVVSHTIRDEGEVEVIRIISARPASGRERREYEETP